MMTRYFESVDGDHRLTMFPVGRQGMWQLYKQAQKCFWVPEEINFSRDRTDYESRLTPGQQRFVDRVLAFFAASDKIVNINIAKRFKEDVNIMEADAFYDFQMAMENIHAETYALQLDTIVGDRAKRDSLLSALETMPSVKTLTDYMFRCIDSSEPFPRRLLMMACVEGVFFSGCFCAIYWLRNRGLMPGLGHANELIARDEGLHTQFALYLYMQLLGDCRLDAATTHDVFREAVSIAKSFVLDALPEPLPEMNAGLMSQYIECVADGLLRLIDVPPLYRVKNPFPFMEQLNLDNKTNFFETRVSEYSKPKNSKGEWDVAADF